MSDRTDKTDAIDDYIWNNVLYNEYTSIIEMARHGNGVRIGTIRNSLRRLLEEKAVTRRWDGNPRYGRYLYKREYRAHPQPMAQPELAIATA